MAGSPTSPFTRDSLSSGLLTAAAPTDALTARRCLLMIKLCLCSCLQINVAVSQDAKQIEAEATLQSD